MKTPIWTAQIVLVLMVQLLTLVRANQVGHSRKMRRRETIMSVCHCNITVFLF